MGDIIVSSDFCLYIINMWFCRLIKNCFALKDVDLRWVRVSANPDPRGAQVFLRSIAWTCACPGGAERRRLYQDCHITLWTVFKISLGSVHDDMIKSVLCINFANGCQEDFIFCLILLSDLLAKQNQNSTHETMAESSSVIQNECHTPTA